MVKQHNSHEPGCSCGWGGGGGPAAVRSTTADLGGGGGVPGPVADVPPPLCLGTNLRKNRPLVPRLKSRLTFFYQGIGFFMFLVDVRQLFRCAGHHFMCVAMGPPIRGDPISHSQAHIPLKRPPPALDPFPEATSP